MANRKKKQPQQRPTASELLYAFMGWLTTRKLPVTLSSRHDASVPAKLLGAFADENKLSSPRKQQPQILIPKHLEDLTVTEPTNQVAKIMTTGEAYSKISTLFNSFYYDDQDAILAQLLTDMKTRRAQDLHSIKMMVGKEEQALDNVQQKVWNLENITRGNFAVTKPLVYDNTKQEAKE